MAQVLDKATVGGLEKDAKRNQRSWQDELTRSLESKTKQVNKAEARALVAKIRRQIGVRPQTDSGILQAEGRAR